MTTFKWPKRPRRSEPMREMAPSVRCVVILESWVVSLTMDGAAFSRRAEGGIWVKVQSGDARVGMTVGCRGAVTSCGHLGHVI